MRPIIAARGSQVARVLVCGAPGAMGLSRRASSGRLRGATDGARLEAAHRCSRSQARRAFWACRRFSAWSQTTLAGPSITSAVISSPRCAGRQCNAIASGPAAASRSALSWNGASADGALGRVGLAHRDPDVGRQRRRRPCWRRPGRRRRRRSRRCRPRSAAPWRRSPGPADSRPGRRPGRAGRP